MSVHAWETKRGAYGYGHIVGEVSSSSKEMANSSVAGG